MDSRAISSVLDAMIIAEAKSGRMLMLNPAAERLFGYSAAEARGLPVEVLIPDHLKRQHRAGIAHYAITGHGRYIDAHTPLLLPAVCKGGEEIVIGLTLSQFPGPHGTCWLWRSFAISPDDRIRGLDRADAERLKKRRSPAAPQHY
jgi:PAS domain S-box-containing protein